MDDDETAAPAGSATGLSVTTVSDLSPLQRYVFCLCSTLPLPTRFLSDRAVARVQAEPRDLVLTAAQLQSVREQRRVQDASTLASIVSTLCRTPPLAPASVSHMLDGAYGDIREMTCGGMARVYAGTCARTGDDVAIKVADSSKGFATYEWRCYWMLRDRGLRVADLRVRTRRGSHTLTVMDRYECTFSALCIALAPHPEHVQRLVRAIQHILTALADGGITYSDFSPDNIVCRIADGGAVQCVLIDPQFATRTSLLAKTLGARWARNVDRVHFAHKMKTLELHYPRVREIGDAMCLALLGHVPTFDETRRFLTKILPSALRCTYDVVIGDMKKYVGLP